jgi:hypothetical protein
MMQTDILSEQFLFKYFNLGGSFVAHSTVHSLGNNVQDWIK